MTKIIYKYILIDLLQSLEIIFYIVFKVFFLEKQ